MLAEQFEGFVVVVMILHELRAISSVAKDKKKRKERDKAFLRAAQKNLEQDVRFTVFPPRTITEI
jgi:hypothetical protein